MDKPWKAFERWLCRRFGGSRTGPTGKDDSDCLGTHPFALEAKHRKEIPSWLRAAINQAEVNGMKRGSDWLPLVVLHEGGTRYEDSLVLLRLGTFLEWYGPTPVDVEENS